MAQLSLSQRTPFTVRRHKRDGSRVVRHEILSLASGLLRAFDIVAVPVAGLVTYVSRYHSVSVGCRHGLILALGMAVVANVMATIDAYDMADLRIWRRQALKVVGGWGVSIAILLTIAFFDKVSDQYSR